MVREGPPAGTGPAGPVLWDIVGVAECGWPMVHGPNGRREGPGHPAPRRPEPRPPERCATARDGVATSGGGLADPGLDVEERLLAHAKEAILWPVQVDDEGRHGAEGDDGDHGAQDTPPTL